MRLEELKRGAQVIGIDPHQLVTVVDVQWHGSNAVELFYKRADGQPGTQLLYRDDAAMLKVAEAGRAWSFDGDGGLLRWYRKRTASIWLISSIRCWRSILPNRTSPSSNHRCIWRDAHPAATPLSVADDPGAGKTVMAGLLIKELVFAGRAALPDLRTG